MCQKRISSTSETNKRAKAKRHKACQLSALSSFGPEAVASSHSSHKILLLPRCICAKTTRQNITHVDFHHQPSYLKAVLYFLHSS